MNKLLLLLLLIGFGANAQENYWSIYVPLHTTHFKKTHGLGTAPYKVPLGFHKGFAGSEGGQGGLIISYNKIKGNHINTTSLIAMQNSYGDPIVGASKGIVFNVGKWRFGGELGFVFGYAKSFAVEFAPKLLDGIYYIYANAHSNFVIKYKIAPVAGITIARNITKRFGMKLIINPSFVNIGLNYQFKNSGNG